MSIHHRIYSSCFCLPAPLSFILARYLPHQYPPHQTPHRLCSHSVAFPSSLVLPSVATFVLLRPFLFSLADVCLCPPSLAPLPRYYLIGNLTLWPAVQSLLESTNSPEEHLSLHELKKPTQTHTDPHRHTQTHKNMQTHTDTHRPIQTHKATQIYLHHTHTHTHTQASTHTNARTHTHTHTHRN